MLAHQISTADAVIAQLHKLGTDSYCCKWLGAAL